MKYVNPLLMPFLHGWQRVICHQSKLASSAKMKWIRYQTPCGRFLRNTGEVEKYLFATDSWLTIDQFSFDHSVSISREFEANATFYRLDDYASGRENMPISVVNCVDAIKPDEFDYQPHRIPLEGVPLDISQEEMEGCDCTDGCRDHTKCACWRKTFEATEFTQKSSAQRNNKNIGYRGRRLPELVQTGIKSKRVYVYNTTLYRFDTH